MSSQSHHKMSGKQKKALVGEIELTERFSEQMAHLCLNEDYSDVTFIVEEQRLPAHRVILAARSEYFRALLFGGLSESNQSEITLKIPLEAFKALLKYIYSGQMPLTQMDEEYILDTLGLANQYGFTELELAISDYLRQFLALNNACAILDAARLYNLERLTKVCLTFIDRNASEIMQHPTFKTLSRESLEEILKRDSFFAPEVQIFLAVSEWCKSNPDEDHESVVSLVRLPLMNLEHLLQVVRPTGKLEPNKILDAIEDQTTYKNMRYRAALFPEENVATAKFVSRCIQGESRTSLLDGDIANYDMEKGYTRHCISDNVDNHNGITVELGSICIINHIKILLWDRDNRAYSYFVDVSVNETHWDRVIDYRDYHCRSWQFLYFKPRPVRFIKLVGVRNTINKVFHVVHLSAMYTSTVPRVVGDIVAPTANVATIEMSAIVVDGVSRTRNALLNGDYINYDWDSGYTCHQLGSGEILVRLGQPYVIGSMRLLLWDCDDRTYSFYILTSVDQKDWEIVVDKRNDSARSWQNFSFKPRPMVFIRIVGTRNTANEIFHCVHLEAPSQDLNFLQLEREKTPSISSLSSVNSQCILPVVTCNSVSSLNSNTSNGSNTPANNAAANPNNIGPHPNFNVNVNQPGENEVLLYLDQLMLDDNYGGNANDQ